MWRRGTDFEGFSTGIGGTTDVGSLTCTPLESPVPPEVDPDTVFPSHTLTILAPETVMLPREGVPVDIENGDEREGEDVEQSGVVRV
jgi:hypothetical protein